MFMLSYFFFYLRPMLKNLMLTCKMLYVIWRPRVQLTGEQGAVSCKATIWMPVGPRRPTTNSSRVAPWLSPSPVFKTTFPSGEYWASDLRRRRERELAFSYYILQCFSWEEISCVESLLPSFNIVLLNETKKFLSSNSDIIELCLLSFWNLINKSTFLRLMVNILTVRV